ncbi:MAG: cytochrome d ubiquinol oxidase subunit II [Gammaproteobacteria bacterium]|jgi:cytochrome d ubiquinol oxidase subunit II|nr:cytochrome d ubiquinol oxidase subunit II [Gammaproteobacteria bacterium]
MLDFSASLDLPLIWFVLIALVMFLYVLLDGFDLGIGILFPLAPTDACRDQMMSSVAPFWDGNETWLVMGGGGLMAVFPLAYAILLPAFYIPMISMLLGLIMRGVAFEFRFKANSRHSRKLWDLVFHLGSLTAALSQGMILGALLTGVDVDGRNFAGGPLDWISSFSIITGIAVVFGYALLGSTWLIMKTDQRTQDWARQVAIYALAAVAVFLGLVSVVTALINATITQFWFSMPNFWFLLPIPLLSVLVLLLCARDLLHKQAEYRPFLLAIAVFALAHIGLGISLYPWIIPYQYTIHQAAAEGSTLSLMLLVVVPMLPLILAYTGYNYFVFRGKSAPGHGYG